MGHLTQCPRTQQEEVQPLCAAAPQLPQGMWVPGAQGASRESGLPRRAQPFSPVGAAGGRHQEAPLHWAFRHHTKPPPTCVVAVCQNPPAGRGQALGSHPPGMEA